MIELTEKKVIRHSSLLLNVFLVMLIAGCSKDESPGEFLLNLPETLNAITDRVTDIEGNSCRIVVVGTQTWMAENLRTSKLNDGTPVPNVTVGSEWVRLTSPGYCWYANNEADNKNTYGALYNWYAVNSGKLAPLGWHVPTQEEWTTLIEYLGGEEKAGGRMKEAGLVYWNSPNADATNLSGFSARAGGGRDCFCSGTHGLKDKGYWWTATASDNKDMAYYHMLVKETGKIDNTADIINYKTLGFSVRCVKDR